MTVNAPPVTAFKERYAVQCVWKEKLDYDFNILLAKPVFRETEPCIITGCECGNVRVYKTKAGLNKGIDLASCKSYETKGGPIHSMLVENVVKFGGCDVIVGDARGTFTTITDGQILNRRSLCSTRISNLMLTHDSADNQTIVAGTDNGTLVGVTPYDIVWKHRIQDLLKLIPQKTTQISITCVHSLHMHNSASDAHYTLVADSNCLVHFFLNGAVVHSITLPAPVTSMCTGTFVADQHASGATAPSVVKAQKPSGEQVALATTSGAIFVLCNMVAVPYCVMSFPVTTMHPVPATGMDAVDALLCTGHFTGARILQNGTMVGTLTTNDWVHTVAVADDQQNVFVLGALDRTVQLVKIVKNR